MRRDNARQYTGSIGATDTGQLLQDQGMDIMSSVVRVTCLCVVRKVGRVSTGRSGGLGAWSVWDQDGAFVCRGEERLLWPRSVGERRAVGLRAACVRVCLAQGEPEGEVEQ